MTEHERGQIGNLGYEAGQIAALLSIISSHLFNEPSTSIISQALEGVQSLAAQLSANLLTIADPE